MSLADWFNWQARRQRPRERVHKDLEVPQLWPQNGMDVKEARLSDTARMRIRKLFGSKP